MFDPFGYNFPYSKSSGRNLGLNYLIELFGSIWFNIFKYIICFADDFVFSKCSSSLNVIIISYFFAEEGIFVRNLANRLTLAILTFAAPYTI
jgi:hypothetical protein